MAAHIKQVAGVANLSSASGAQQPEQPSPLPKHAVFASATVTFASHALVLDSNATMRDICASAFQGIERFRDDRNTCDRWTGRRGGRSGYGLWRERLLINGELVPRLGRHSRCGNLVGLSLSASALVGMRRLCFISIDEQMSTSFSRFVGRPSLRTSLFTAQAASFSFRKIPRYVLPTREPTWIWRRGSHLEEPHYFLEAEGMAILCSRPSIMLYNAEIWPLTKYGPSRNCYV